MVDAASVQDRDGAKQAMPGMYLARPVLFMVSNRANELVRLCLGELAPSSNRAS